VPSDSEDYRIHFDCYVCFDCKHWDLPDAFYNPEQYVDLPCTRCDSEQEHLQTYFDLWNGQLEFKCCTCGQIKKLQLIGSNLAEDR